MSKIVVKIPKTANAARKQIVQFDAAEHVGKWHKAAICYAYRAKHYDTIGDMRAADQAAADELDTKGYGAWTIKTYATRWADAGLDDVRPGDDAEIPDLDDLPWESITGSAAPATDKVTAAAAKKVVEAAKSNPEIAKAMADAIVKDDDDLDFTIERAIDKSREEHLEENGVTPISKSTRREADASTVHMTRLITDALGQLNMLATAINTRLETDDEWTDGLRAGFYEKYVAQLEGYHELLKRQLLTSTTEDTGDWDQALADLMATTEGGE